MQTSTFLLMRITLTAMGSTNGYYAENTVTQPTSIPQPYYELYVESPEHYEAMVSDKYNCFGKNYCLKTGSLI